MGDGGTASGLTKRSRMSALGVAVFLVLTGVVVVTYLAWRSSAVPSGRAAGEHACEPLAVDEHVHEPKVRAVAGDGRDALEHRWTKDPTEGDLFGAASSGPSRADAERFAFLVAQRVLDSREEADDQARVDALAADAIPEGACKHLVTRARFMHELGWGSYVSSAYPVFHRSRATGSDANPERVELELVVSMKMENDPHLFGDTSESEIWMRVRVDVVRQGDVWLLADWAGPEAAGTPREQKIDPKYYGTGWTTWEPEGS